MNWVICIDKWFCLVVYTDKLLRVLQVIMLTNKEIIVLLLVWHVWAFFGTFCILLLNYITPWMLLRSAAIFEAKLCGSQVFVRKKTRGRKMRYYEILSNNSLWKTQNNYSNEEIGKVSAVDLISTFDCKFLWCRNVVKREIHPTRSFNRS